MKMMQGALALPCANRSRTRLAPTPTNISTKSEPLMEKNGTSASPATAFARSVLPVPGGPTSRTPRGTLPPRRWNFLGDFRNSIISRSSSLASSTPATSANVVFGRSALKSLALLRPNEKAFPPPPAFRMKYTQNPIRIIMGAMLSTIWRKSMRGGRATIRTSWACSESITALSSRGTKLVNLSYCTPSMFTGSKNSPDREPPVSMTTLSTRPVETRSRKLV